MPTMIPGRKAVQRLTGTHERTFFIELNDDDEFILYLKLTPTQMLSIFNGAPISLIVASTALPLDTVLFVMSDIIGSPFWLSQTLKLQNDLDGNTDSAPELPYPIKQLASASLITVALFDWNASCLYAESVAVSRSTQTLEEWHKRLQLPLVNRTTDSQVTEQGYALDISPFTERAEFEWIDVGFKSRVGKNPYLVSTNKYTGSLVVSRYSDKGKHGYLQEYLLSFELSKYFQSDIDLFISPRTNNETELTDLVISSNDIVILIESKASMPFEGFPRKSGAAEKSLTKLIRKAIEQLGTAREIVNNSCYLIENYTLQKKCETCSETVSLCVVDDTFMIDARSVEKALDASGVSAKGTGTYIIGIEDFLGVLSRAHSKKDIIDKLQHISKVIPPDRAVPVIQMGP